MSRNTIETTERRAKKAHSAETIERRAEEVRRRAGALSIPIDLNRGADALGVKVHHETLEDQISGVLIVKGSERHVLVNKTHHSNRQRFTTSHEFGHLVLHDEDAED